MFYVKVRLPLTCSMYLDIQCTDYFYDFCLEEAPHPSSSHLAVVAQRTILLISILKQSILRYFFLNICALVKHQIMQNETKKVPWICLCSQCFYGWVLSCSVGFHSLGCCDWKPAPHSSLKKSFFVTLPRQRAGNSHPCYLQLIFSPFFNDYLRFLFVNKKYFYFFIKGSRHIFRKKGEGESRSAMFLL